jgi:uncharacterized membrane protein YraQ (UPF0718 family)
MSDGGFASAFVTLSLDAAPWLLLGLVVAGLVKAWFPEDRLKMWLGGRGLRPIIMAALIGAPLPLCSCGVIPAAVALRRGGASREATVSFLVSTPETGVDSIAVSYAFFGPFLTVVRPIAAIFTAVTTALISALVPDSSMDVTNTEGSTCSSSSCGCPAAGSKIEGQQANINDGADAGMWTRAWNGIVYALSDMLRDILPWILFGLVLAAALTAFVPAGALTQWGGGVFGMIVMVIVGIPMYVCATAATPIAAGLLMAGVSPGAAMVFLLAGPATNVATLGVVKRELGGMVALAYLAGIIVCSILAGLAVNAVAGALAIDIRAQAADVGDLVPLPLAVASAVLLAVLGVVPLVGRIIPLTASAR